WHYPHEVKDGVSKLNGQPIETGRVEKMSKSKRNVIDTQGVISTHGMDSARMFTLFASPPEKDVVWTDEGVEGVHRFLSRVWRLTWEHREAIKSTNAYSGNGSDLDDPARALRKIAHKTISAVTDDIEKRFHFNTAIARLMELANALYKYEVGPTVEPGFTVFADAIRALTNMLAPFAPHTAEELWEEIGDGQLVADAPWPEFDPEVAADEVVTVAVQVLGKLRARVEMPAGVSREEMERLAMANDNVQRHIEGKTVRKVIVVPGKLVNIVAN
ncbi:MAG: class I tRNA ligase family protein, partial [Deltaproteobacteria bacterium]|nr:class I tRNA ligase family protein [Deltaproteobacteria bacterium]